MESFAVLEPLVNGFRNYVKGGVEEFVSCRGCPEHALVDQALFFEAVFAKVINLDRYDLHPAYSGASESKM